MCYKDSDFATELTCYYGIDKRKIDESKLGQSKGY
jgi:hypothetical protein